LGRNPGHIQDCLRGVKQTAYGFKWRFRESSEVPVIEYIGTEPEELATIPGYPGYWVNQYGQVWSCKLETYLVPVTNRNYATITLVNKGSRKTITIHRLVASVFLEVPPDSDKMVVNHIDGNKFNNHYRNLEWTTLEENTQKAIEQGLISTRPVCRFTVEGDFQRRYNSFGDAVRDTGGNKHIMDVLAGRRPRASGSVWYYEADCVKLDDGTYSCPRANSNQNARP
jgi:hypothetical protein